MNTALRVLLVEDNPGDADLIQEALAGRRTAVFEVTVVSRLSEALAALHGGQFALVLVDLGLPDSQGIETFERLRAAAPDVPMMVLMGDSDEEKGLAAMKLGAQDCVFKSEVAGPLLVRAARYAVERGRAEREIRESERRLKEAQRLGRIGDWEFDVETREIRWSDMVFAIYERDPSLGPPTAEEEGNYYAAEDTARLRECSRRTIETGDPYDAEVRLLLPGGRHADVAVIGAPGWDTKGKIVRVAGTVQDITKSKRASNEERIARDVLAVLNRMYGTDTPIREILPLVQRGTDFDVASIHLREGEAFSYGRIARRGDEEGGPLRECICCTILDNVDGETARAFAVSGSFWANSASGMLTSATGTEQLGPMCKCCRAQGYESLALIPLRSHDEVIGLLRLADQRPGCIDRELITFLEVLGSSIGLALARRRAEKRLLELSKAVDSSGEVIFVTDRDGVFRFVNPEFTHLYGYAADEVVGKTTPRILKSGAMSAEAYEKFWTALAARQAQNGEIINKTKAGRLLPVDSVVNPIIDSGDNLIGYVAIQRDITERRELEARFRHSQKMEAVGRLAGGVAHDFNNILTVIGGGCMFLEEGLKEGDPLLEEVRTIRTASQSAVKLTRQLLGFSRRQILAPRVLDLDAEVRGMEKMLKRLLAEDIVINVESGSAGAFISADPGQIEQIIVNLAVNAGDAMAVGGRLTITTEALDLDEAAARSRGVDRAGAYVRLAITDTGVGMDAETRARIFEPFFTTKESGKGTGLGLSTVYGIVQQSGGSLRALSELGSGTTIEMYFPRVELSDHADHQDIAPVVVPSHGEAVLVVDDNAQVCAVTARMLVQDGYRVLVAPGMEEARRIAATDGPVHLLLTDVVMPEGGGRDVADAVLESNPAAKVLFMSGYTDDAVLRLRVLDRDVAFLHKPFTAAVLAKRVREVLDGVE